MYVFILYFIYIIIISIIMKTNIIMNPFRINKTHHAANVRTVKYRMS